MFAEELTPGGCRVDPDYVMPGELLSKPCNWRADAILELMRWPCYGETSKALETEAAIVASQLSTLTSCLDAHEYTVNNAVNSSITIVDGARPS